jgi:hypothetical protein
MFNAPDAAAGKKAKCPKCGGVIVIPTPGVAEEEILEAEPEPVAGFSDEDFEVEPPAERPAVDDRKPCPMCGEMIQKDAVKCRYCGEIFDPVLKKKEQKTKVTAADEDMSTGDWVVAILCSTIGCIAGIVWMIQGKPKGKKMLLVSLIMQFVWGAVRVFVEMMAQGNM